MQIATAFIARLVRSRLPDQGHRSGYTSHAAFSRAFKAQFSNAPSELRQRQKPD